MRTSTAARLLGVSAAYIAALQLVGILERGSDPEWLPLSAFSKLADLKAR